MWKKMLKEQMTEQINVCERKMERMKSNPRNLTIGGNLTDSAQAKYNYLAGRRDGLKAAIEFYTTDCSKVNSSNKGSSSVKKSATNSKKTNDKKEEKRQENARLGRK